MKEIFDIAAAVANTASDVQHENQGSTSLITQGVWQAVEPADSDLSQVKLESGDIARGVPKGTHVTGLVAGDLVYMIRTGSIPLTILMKVAGNITLYTE